MFNKRIKKGILYLAIFAVLFSFGQIINTRPAKAYDLGGAVHDCFGGDNAGKKCKDDGDCPGGRCVKMLYPEPIELQVPIGDMTQVAQLKDYINNFYVWFLGFVSIIAVVMIAWAGFKWLTAAGNQTRIANAKTGIVNALIGLVLAYTSYLLLVTINPGLVEFRNIAVPLIETIEMTGSFCIEVDPLDYDDYEDKGGKAYKPGAGCGEKFYYGGNTDGSYCLGEKCNGKTICDWITDPENVKCESEAAYCGKHSKATTSNNCTMYDEAMEHWAEVSNNSIYKNKACRKVDTVGTDYCVLGALLKCGTNEERINCAAPGNKSKCWDNNTHEDCSGWIGTDRLWCQDQPDFRANEKADGICCAKKNDADCKEVTSCADVGRFVVDLSYCGGSCPSGELCCAKTYCKH